MPENLVFEGLTVAPNVIETIVRIATEQTEGVAFVGSGPVQGAAALLKTKAPGVEITVVDDDVATAGDSAGEGSELAVVVHITARHGVKLQELGAAVQSAIADALGTQLGVRRLSVEVYIDALDFGE